MNEKKVYRVNIQEIYGDTYRVLADSPESAKEIVKKAYWKQTIMFPLDLVETCIDTVDDEGEDYVEGDNVFSEKDLL